MSDEAKEQTSAPRSPDAAKVQETVEKERQAALAPRSTTIPLREVHRIIRERKQPCPPPLADSISG